VFFHTAETPLANEISMVHREMIQQLHAQGFSNRESARRLELHRDTVNRHVRLLNAQNQPKAPPGNLWEKQPVEWSESVPAGEDQVHAVLQRLVGPPGRPMLGR
jgi:DNA-binding CsgD family transcriptional regulator